jgi:multicomponent Na+:H+ antiporter subunit F
MTSATTLAAAVDIAIILLIVAMLVTTLRVVLGPTLADRVLALDQLVAIVIGFIAVVAVKTGFGLYIDIALALGLVGFLATAAFARYIQVTRGPRQNPGKKEGENEPR